MNFYEYFDYKDGELYWKKTVSNRALKGSMAGSITLTGYKQTRCNGKFIKNHRIIYAMHHGYMPKFIDHIDGNKLNNQISNLRPCTIQQNSYNKKSSGVSGYKNIYWHPQSGKWQVKVNKKYYGIYADIELAELVATEVRNKLHGNFAKHF